jgi:hypothetical protein
MKIRLKVAKPAPLTEDEPSPSERIERKKERIER